MNAVAIEVVTFTKAGGPLTKRIALTPEGQMHRDHVSRALARTGAAPASVIEADGWPLMLGFVSRGLGIAVVNGTCTPPRGAVLEDRTGRCVAARGSQRSRRTGVPARCQRRPCRSHHG